jgi:hypothetical protein
MAAEGLAARDRPAPRRQAPHGPPTARKRRAADYRRAPQGSKPDAFEPVLRPVLAEWPAIKAPRMAQVLRDDYGYDGSVDLVKRRLHELRRPPARPAQRTSYRPGQVLGLDWAERRRARGSLGASAASTPSSPRSRTPAPSRRTSRSI